MQRDIFYSEIFVIIKNSSLTVFVSFNKFIVNNLLPVILYFK